MKKTFTIFVLVVFCLIAAGSVRASHWVVDTTITYDTTEVTLKPAAWDDDGYVTGTDSVFRTLGYIVFIHNGTIERGPGLVRFPNVPINQGQGGSLLSLKLRLYINPTYDDLSAYIFYEDTANATALLTAATSEIFNRALSSDSILWDDMANGGGWKYSPELSTLFESLFNRADWDSANALAVILHANYSQAVDARFVAFDYGDPTYYPQLVISWQDVDTTYDSLLLGDYSMTWTGKDSIDDTHIMNILASDSNSSGDIDHLFNLGSYGAGDERHALLRANNFASQFPYDSSYVIWAGWRLKVQSVSGPPDTLYVKQLWKPCWIEGTGGESSCGNGGASWWSWSCPSQDWTTPGANSADDNGEVNYGDGTGADRKDSPESFVTDLTAETGVWVRLDITDLVKRTLAGDLNDSTGIILNVSENWISFYSTNADLDGPTFWPIFEITYDLPQEAAPKYLPFIRRP